MSGKKLLSIIKDVLLFIGMPVLVILYIFSGRRIDELSERRDVLERRIDGDIRKLSEHISNLERITYSIAERADVSRKLVRETRREIDKSRQELDRVRESVGRSSRAVKESLNAVERLDAINTRFRELIQRLPGDD